MSIQTVDLVVDRIGQFLAQNPDDHVQIVWHGGEPSLMPLSFWEYVEIAFGRLEAQNISMSMQSNLISNDSTKYKKLLGNGYRISSSLDGTRDLHRASRQTTISQYDNILRNIELVKKSQNTAGVICVVSRVNFDRVIDLLNFYERLGVDVRFNKVDSRDERFYLGYDEYFGFLIEVAHSWLESPESKILVEPIASDISRLLGVRQGRSCNQMPDCYRYFMALGPTGMLYPCNRFVGLEEWQYGHLDAIALGDIWHDNAESPFLACQRSLDECNSCYWQDYCEGGCNRMYITSDSSERVNFCSSIANYLNDLYSFLQSKSL